MNKEDLIKALEQHKDWLGETGGKKAVLRYTAINNFNLNGAVLKYADLINTDLKYSSLRGADLSSTDLRNADLSYVDLSGADLSGADLSNAKLVGANLSGVIFRNANMNNTDLTGAIGLMKQTDFMAANFEKSADGYIAYVALDTADSVHTGRIITDNANFNRSNYIGSGINAAPLDYMLRGLDGIVWKVLIKWEWLCGVCVPYSTEGKIRCERVQLIQPVKNDIGYMAYEK